jgi:hypothetical protein
LRKIGNFKEIDLYHFESSSAITWGLIPSLWLIANAEVGLSKGWIVVEKSVLTHARHGEFCEVRVVTEDELHAKFI